MGTGSVSWSGTSVTTNGPRSWYSRPGQANHAQSGQLLQSLLESGQDSQHRRRILAIACLDAVRSVDATVRTKAETVIPDLLPPRSMEQAEQLSKAGEPLIPPLARNWTRDTRKAPETIRAAALRRRDLCIGAGP